MMRTTTRALLAAALAMYLSGCEIVDIPRSEPAVTPATSVIVAPPAVAAPGAAALLQQARAAVAIGDDARAGELLSALLQTSSAAPEATTARYLLAASFARRERWTSAAELLRPLLAELTPDHALRAPALFLLARSLEAAGDHAAAAATYQEYRALATPLEPYAAMRQAAQERAQGQLDAAATNYLHAARSELAPGERAGSFEKAIALLRELGRAPEALELYNELLAFAERSTYRAGLLADAAALADELGQGEQARAWRLELVATEVMPQAVDAVDRLLSEGAGELTPAAAGRVYFAAERWAEAVAELDGAIAQTTDPATSAELRRLRGLAIRAQGDFAQALAALADASATSPNSDAGRQAQLDWVQTLGQSGAVEQAIQGYGEFAAAYPDDPRAPVALERVVVLRERLDDGEGALQARLELGRRYPASDEGSLALHDAGLALLEAQRLDEAEQAWRALAEGSSGAERAQGAFWAARAARARGDENAARELWAVAQLAAPASYYGARAADELGQPAGGGSVALGTPLSEADWNELAAWLTGWSGQTAPAADTQGDAGVRRALGLDEIGLQSEAIAEWLEALRERREEPFRLLELARAAHEANVPYVALQTAERLARLAPADAQPAPAALLRLVYPTPFGELVAREAGERGVDPLLLYALIRQESLFNPGATSWVGARGLGQIMPETGQGIAQDLGEPAFTLDDLYRPAVSVRFAAYYIGQRIGNMEGSVQGALAAYNGGLGNAQRWAEGSRVADPDLFTERIDYAETKGYVKAVYGFWAAYRELYAGG